MGDKDTRGILTALEPAVSEIVVTQNSSPRAMPADELALLAGEVFGDDRVLVEHRLEDAIETAVRLAEETAEPGEPVSGAGVVLAEVGITAGLPTMILLPLLSTSFSTAGQIAQILREDDSASLFMHEGLHYDLYCFDVLQRFMLVIVFDKAASAAKIGSVWVYAKRAIRDIQEVLA